MNLQLILFLMFTPNFIGCQKVFSWLSSCKTNADCDQYKNATCLDGFCKCEKPFNVCENIDNNVIKINRIGGKCDNTTRICNPLNSLCNSENICVCENGFITSNNSLQCLEMKCNNNEECVDKIINSVCVNSKCVCSDSNFLIGVKCFPLVRSIGDGCENDNQCKNILGNGGKCFGKSCQCREDYHYKNSTKKCVKDLFLDEICTTTEDCHQPGQETINRLMCIEGRCKCRLNYTEDNSYCIAKDGNNSMIYTLSKSLFFSTIIFIFVNC